MLAIDVGGFHVPDAGPVFLTALALHVAAGATAIVAGVLATPARQRPRRHPRAGAASLSPTAGRSGTAPVWALRRWRQVWLLFVTPPAPFALPLWGGGARPRRPRRWMAWHGSAMAGSYVALFTGFYVDNGPQLPV